MIGSPELLRGTNVDPLDRPVPAADTRIGTSTVDRLSEQGDRCSDSDIGVVDCSTSAASAVSWLANCE